MDRKFIQQLQGAYSLLRHVSREDFLARCRSIARKISEVVPDEFDFAGWRPDMLMDDRKLRRCSARQKASGNVTGPSGAGPGGTVPHGDPSVLHDRLCGIERSITSLFETQLESTSSGRRLNDARRKDDILGRLIVFEGLCAKLREKNVELEQALIDATTTDDEAQHSDSEMLDIQDTVDDIDKRVYDHAAAHEKLQRVVHDAVRGMHRFQECMEESYPRSSSASRCVAAMLLASVRQFAPPHCLRSKNVKRQKRLKRQKRRQAHSRLEPARSSRTNFRISLRVCQRFG